MFENNNDGYYVNCLYQGEFYDYILLELVEFLEFLLEEIVGFYCINGMLYKDVSFNLMQKVFMLVFFKLNDEECNCMVFVNLLFSLLLVLICDVVIYLIFRVDGLESY